MRQCRWSAPLTLLFEKFGPFTGNQEGQGALELRINLLGGRALHILDQLGHSVHWHSFDVLANEILLVEGKLSGTVVFVI